MKGKYAARAANRTEAAEQETAEAVYRRRVLQLTEQRDAANAAKDEALSEWRKEVRILRAQLAEGTSPRVEALSRELDRMRSERDSVKRAAASADDKHKVGVGRIIEHFKAEHSMTQQAAFEMTMALLVGEDFIIADGLEAKFASNHGTGALLAIRKARGQR